jgi:hypothetical protein
MLAKQKMVGFIFVNPSVVFKYPFAAIPVITPESKNR